MPDESYIEELKISLFGITVELSPEAPEGKIIMNPIVWHKLASMFPARIEKWSKYGSKEAVDATD